MSSIRERPMSAKSDTSEVMGKTISLQKQLSYQELRKDKLDRIKKAGAMGKIQRSVVGLPTPDIAPTPPLTLPHSLCLSFLSFSLVQPQTASLCLPPHSASINPDLASLNLFPLYSLILPLTLPRPIWQTTSNHMQHVLDILVFKTSTQKQNVREIHKILGILKARIPHAIWMSTSSLNLLRLTWSTRRWRKGKFLLSSGRKTKRLTPSCRGGSKESFVSLWLVVVIRSC